MKRPNIRPSHACLAVLGAIPLLLAACRSMTGLMSPLDRATPSAATIAVEPDAPRAGTISVQRAERSGEGADDIVYDASQMAELPCHSMGFTIMGQCTDAEVQLVAAEIRRRADGTQAVGIIEASKLGGAASSEPAAANRGDTAEVGDAAAEPTGDLAAGRDLGDGIVYDPEAMAESPCHAMGATIMGRCSPEDLDRMKAELLVKQRAARGQPTPRPDILPGDVPRRDPAMGGMIGASGTAPSGERVLAEVGRPLPLADGGRTKLRAQLARWKVDGVELAAYAYNGQIPGPQLQVRQGSRVEVAFDNEIDMETTIHWHGLRHANGFDGVPGVTQSVVEPGGSFVYELYFPDPGLYWYHPHVREDLQQDGGLYGTILVTPDRDDYWAPADRETVLVLDDVLIEDGAGVGYAADGANFAIMGRFGNKLLVNGQTDYQQVVDAGSVVRYYLVNVANVRPFRVSFDGARMKKVGADLGRQKVETWVDEVVLAPAERVIVEVAFDESRRYRIQHRSSEQTYELGTVTAVKQPAGPSEARAVWGRLRVDPRMNADANRLKAYRDMPPEMDLELTIDIPDLVVSARPALDGDDAAVGDSALAEAGAEAGTKLDEHAAEEDSHGPIEWEDEMLAVNRASKSDGVHWMIRDRLSGAVNHDLAYTFRVGDMVRVRLHNLSDSDHPMQHPIHFHGQRLMILSRNGEVDRNPVWKDTILTTPGETVELLMEVTNPGAWMAHCHIAEHLETGMMFQFQVLPADDSTT